MGIARNAGYNLAGAVIPLAVSIVTVPFYIRAVGVERYGVLSLCWLILGFMGFLNLGMGPAVAQRLASLHSAPGEERARAFWTAIWLNMALGVVAAVAVLMLGAAYFQTFSRASSQFMGEIRHAMPWLALMIPTVMLSGVMSGALQGRERFLALNLINSVSSVLMSVLPLAAALFVSARLDVLIVAAMAGKVAALVLTYGACARAVPLGRPHRPVPRLMRQLVSFGGWVTITSLLVPIVVTMDRFVIGALIGPAAVSIYSIPFNLISRINILPVSLAGALFPRFAAAEGSDAADLQAEGVSALVSILTPASILMIAALGPFLHIWIGPRLAAQAMPLGYIFVTGFWMNSIAHVPYAYLEARGRPDLIAKLHIAYLVPYLGVLYFCLSRFGVVGAAVAWSVRSFFDPTLFILAGTFRRVMPKVAAPALLVYAAMAVALLFSWTGWAHWLLLAVLFAASALISVRLAPALVRERLNRLPGVRRYA
jgi:O-antigen/teichoic acid export membrane protein